MPLCLLRLSVSLSISRKSKSCHRSLMNFWEDGLWMMCFSHNKNSQHECSSQLRRSNLSLGYTFHGQRSCPGSTTAMLCFTVHRPALFRNCSEFRTMQLRLCSNAEAIPRQAVTTPAALVASPAVDNIQVGSSDIES